MHPHFNSRVFQSEEGSAIRKATKQYGLVASSCPSPAHRLPLSRRRPHLAPPPAFPQRMTEEGEEQAPSDLIRSAAGAASSPPPPRPSILPAFNAPPSRPQFRDAAAGAKRPGIPPAHPNGIPYSLPVPHSAASRSLSSHAFTAAAAAAGIGGHSRSLSQPAFFNLDFPGSHFPDSNASNPVSPAGAPMDDRDRKRLVRSGSDRDPADDGLRPRKAHRRSQSDIPYGFLSASPPTIPPRAPGFISRPPVKQESEWEQNSSDRGDEHDLFNAYMNLDSLDALNSDSSTENESESSSVHESGSSGPPRKRIAIGDPLPIASRHCRSVSMDSFMEKANFGEESPMLPPSRQPGHHSHSGSMDGKQGAFSLEFGNGEFNPTEITKIMANERLAEIAIADPKRAKRILANRQSAARSKERKMRYISELEHKVQTLQTEATTVSAQLTMLQRDSVGLTSQNNEMKFCLESMEQQAQLRDALNEALNAEVQRLKLIGARMG